MINLVIPAAGAATRLRPLSTSTSKVMVRVNGKPCLDYIIEQARKVADIGEIVVVDGQFNDIREYCERRHPDVKFAKQYELNGPRDAIRIGIDALSNINAPLVVWLGDAIILEDDLPLGKDFLLTKEVDDHAAWCMWDGSCFYNKPEKKIKDGVALVGLYSFADGMKATNAFNATDGYDISDALELYSETTYKSFQKVTTDKWYDIGDLPTYYKTCATLLNMKARVFNTMSYDHDLGVLTKHPDYHDRSSVQTIRDERSWYDSINEEQRCFTPRVFDTKNDSEVMMAFESGTLLSDLMLYENLTASSWEYIIDKVFRIKTKYFNKRSTNQPFVDSFSDRAEDIWIKKTGNRLLDTNLTSTAKQRIKDLVPRIVANTYPIEVMHGDLHFANIIYNQQTDQMKLIDPRGNYGGTTPSGDNLYDWAKLAHDLYHGYNAMVADVPMNLEVREIFRRKLREYDLPADLIIEGGLVLLATCIPLHHDAIGRQQRFINYVEEYVNENYRV